MTRLALYLEIESANAPLDDERILGDVAKALDPENYRLHEVIPSWLTLQSAVVRLAPRYRVTYYDKVRSRKGKGVQVQAFDDLDKARAFAAANILYSKPCVVEVV